MQSHMLLRMVLAATHASALLGDAGCKMLDACIAAEDGCLPCARRVVPVHSPAPQ